MRVAAPLALRNGDREKSAKMASSRAGEAGLTRLDRVVLLAADGLPHTEVAERCGDVGADGAPLGSSGMCRQGPGAGIPRSPTQPQLLTSRFR